jgi:hypothetical protein
MSRMTLLLGWLVGGQRRLPGPWLWCLPLLLTLVSGGADAAGLSLPKEGWVSWRVAAVTEAPNWCCFEQKGGVRQSRGCQLDGRESYYSSDDDDGQVDQMQIYARFAAGQLQRIHAYGPSCPVNAQTEITDLGEVDTEASLHWLSSQITPRNALSADVLAALATHAGEHAEELLARTASDDASRRNRKDALFWLGQLRGETGARRVEHFLTGDPDSGMREHAAFVVSQSKSPRRGELLITQASSDSSAQVRSQAWFWLAQSGDPRSEAAIQSALKTETSSKVRHQAIFALSQLPDDRAPKALIALLKDSSMGRDERKQALFWLGQSESDDAWAYLGQVLQ